MEYTKTEWSSGDTITAEKLNNMEDGIASGIKCVVLDVDQLERPSAEEPENLNIDDITTLDPQIIYVSSGEAEVGLDNCYLYDFPDFPFLIYTYVRDIGEYCLESSFSINTVYSSNFIPCSSETVEGTPCSICLGENTQMVCLSDSGVNLFPTNTIFYIGEGGDK